MLTEAVIVPGHTAGVATTLQSGSPIYTRPGKANHAAEDRYNDSYHTQNSFNGPIVVRGLGVSVFCSNCWECVRACEPQCD